MAVIGIDLGTTNSLAAYWKDGEARLIPDETGSVLVPSVVSFQEGEGLSVGQQAKERRMLDETAAVGSFKRFMGTEKTYQLGQKNYTPMQLSAMVLEKMKRNAECYLKEEITEAIITVPAYFNDKQRSDTKKAAQIAGLPVERLINEPSAAALAYRMQYGEEDKSLLIFDFGGGTLDLSYVECFENIIEIVAVAGDNYLGGDDIDRLIAEYFCRECGVAQQRLTAEERAALWKTAEAAKRQLEQEPEVKMTVEIAGESCSASLNEEILFEICTSLFAKIRELFLHILEDAGSGISDVDDLIMVGGSSRLSVVKRFLRELLGKEPIVLGNTDQVVAMGAGAYAGIRQRKEEIRDLLMTDVCPFTLGVETHHRQSDENGYMLPMIERNSTLPASRCERLFTLDDYQKAVTIKIYQGEEYYAKDNLYLGEVTVKVPQKKAGKEWVDVYFTYDINGILQVEAVNAKGERNRILLANQSLSKAELARCQKELEQILFPPIQQEKNQEMLRKLTTYYEQSTGERRQQIGALIDWFTSGLNSGRLHVRKKVTEEMERQLALLEEFEGRKAEIFFDGELKQEKEREEL
ncbi:MAG: Hsp70 family protein [Roseburia sp.]|nr:Hsp70 family protein [Roseburia sp.]